MALEHDVQGRLPDSRRPHTTKRRPLILCVEDNDDSRALYAAFLSRAGFRVAEAKNGAEGLERARTLAPDLVVLDIALPVMDGAAMLNALRGEGGPNADVPVIVVTGQAFPGHWRDAIDRGCDAYLTKPCPLGDLLAAVLKVISLKRAGIDMH
jgi:CheY-like chemotaxis protein